MNLKKVKDNNTDTIIGHISSLLADELNAWYSYWTVVPFLQGQDRVAMEEEWQKHADEELAHATKLRERLAQLGCNSTGVATPATWDQTAVCKLVPMTTVELVEHVKMQAQAEFNAIKHYQQVIPLCEAVGDYTTRDILKANLADEEQHLTEMRDYLADYGIEITLM